jgi:hypothetical protein
MNSLLLRSLKRLQKVRGYVLFDVFEKLTIVLVLNHLIITAYWLSVRSVLWNIRPRTERRRSEVHAENSGLIFHSTDRTSEVNNRFSIWLNCEHMLFARIKSAIVLFTGYWIYARHACSIKNNLVVWNFYL